MKKQHYRVYTTERHPNGHETLSPKREFDGAVFVEGREAARAARVARDDFRRKHGATFLVRSAHIDAKTGDVLIYVIEHSNLPQGPSLRSR